MPKWIMYPVKVSENDWYIARKAGDKQQLVASPFNNRQACLKHIKKYEHDTNYWKGIKPDVE